MIFVDTSAFLAVLNASDEHHQVARDYWVTAVQDQEALVCSNYVLLETFALIQNRLGMSIVNRFQNDVLPVMRIEWIDETLHRAGVAALLAANRRNLSLVDCISFEVARRQGIREVFTFDGHFREQGFICKPQ
ncbi:MAG: PIN domain-containing protein [Caldilineales bacterium]|nr:PIN domain-containing protein [Caldilineales bacterium]